MVVTRRKNLQNSVEDQVVLYITFLIEETYKISRNKP
jgi:hypothetical protein